MCGRHLATIASFHFDDVAFVEGQHTDEVFSFGLHEFIDSLQIKLNDIGTAVGETFFGYQPAPKMSADPPPPPEGSLMMQE